LTLSALFAVIFFTTVALGKSTNYSVLPKEAAAAAGCLKMEEEKRILCEKERESLQQTAQKETAADKRRRLEVRPDSRSGLPGTNAQGSDSIFSRQRFRGIWLLSIVRLAVAWGILISVSDNFPL
jgi:hypothetical protein